jgi:D-sedoheptulose 7-phosphate isomerase
VKTVCIAGRTGGKAKELADLCIIIPGSSRFPGQTGGNDNNFHIEDFQSSITHMVTGILKQKVMEGYALQH